MRSVLAVSLLVLLLGCQKKSTESDTASVDNPATRYVEDLKDDKSQAAQAVDKFNDAARQQEKAAREAANQ